MFAYMRAHLMHVITMTTSVVVMTADDYTVLAHKSDLVTCKLHCGHCDLKIILEKHICLLTGIHHSGYHLRKKKETSATTTKNTFLLENLYETCECL